MNIDTMYKSASFNNVMSSRASESVAPKQEQQAVKESSFTIDTVQAQTTGGANFVAKIKGTNEAVGFISTAMKGLDAIASSENPADTAKTFNFNGKNILDSQTFDTTAGIVGVSIYLGDLNQANPDLSTNIENSKKELQNLKQQLSSPVNTMKAKQEESLKTQASSSQASGGATPFMSKISSLLDGIETSANTVGNKIF